MGAERAWVDGVEVKKGEAMAAAVVPLLLTIPQAASVLAVGRTTVYELIGAGDLEAVHIGRSVRVPVDALRSFVARRRVSVTGYLHRRAQRLVASRPFPCLTSRRK